jgi:hypothetical protein
MRWGMRRLKRLVLQAKEGISLRVDLADCSVAHRQTAKIAVRAQRAASGAGNGSPGTVL